MQVMVIVLNKTEYTETVIGLLKKAGIRGATILDGLGSKRRNNDLNTISFLATLVNNLDQRSHAKKVIFSVVEKESHIDKATTLINETVNTSDDKETGAFMFTIPVNYMRGGELERHIIRRDGKYI